MRIGIDARFYGPTGKGLGRYTQKLIEHLEKNDLENHYFIFLRKENFSEYEPQNANFHKVMADYRWYSFAEQIMMPILLRRYKLDLAHFLHFNVPLLYRRRFVVTIHDLILIHFPTIKSSTLNPLFYRLKFSAYKIAIGSAIRRARAIIAVSKFTARDIFENYAVPAKKINVIYEACDDFCQVSPATSEEIFKKHDLISENYGLPAGRHGIIKPYIVYVGNVYPHKNPERLIFGFAAAQRDKFPDLRLVFIGGEDYFYRRLKQFVISHGVKNVIFTGRVNDNELGILLRGARLCARPSLYEGFELPALEAMACGVPVISSEHACAREILEESALYFDPESDESLTEAIEKVLTDDGLRQDLIKKGHEQIKKYNWGRMADETLKIYNRIFK